MPRIARQWSQFEPQNPGFVFNRSLPIFTGCVSFGVVWDGRPYDLINAVALDGTGAVGDAVRTYGRYATVGSGASDGWFIPINPAVNFAGVNTGSIFSAHYCTVSNTTFKRIVRAANSVSGSVIAMSAGDGSFNSIIGSVQATGPTFPISRSSLTPAANTPYSSLFTRSGGTHRLYVDGASVARTDVNLYTNNFIANVNQIYVGTSGGSSPLTGGVLAWGVWNRVLTADEAQFLHQAVTLSDWNWLFEPRRIWVPQTAASGLPTLSLSTYKPGTLTASGWTPRITAT